MEAAREYPTFTLLGTLGRGDRAVVRGRCTLDGCGWESNPRAEAETVVRDVARHQADAHPDAVRALLDGP